MPLIRFPNPFDRLFHRDILARSLSDWLRIRDYRASRRYLETHLELLEPWTDPQLNALEQRFLNGTQATLTLLRPRLRRAIDRSEPLPNDAWKELKRYGRLMDRVDAVHDVRLLLQDIRARCEESANPIRAVRAIRDGYVNAGSAWWLDLPPWLEEIDRRVNALFQADPDSGTAAARITLLRSALDRARVTGDVSPPIMLEMSSRLGDALQSGVEANAAPSAAQEEAIACYEVALTLYTAARFPVQHAGNLANLAAVYIERVAGNRADNLERAIACLEAALAECPAEKSPKEHATLQNNLGGIYAQRVAESKADNLERAIACFQAALEVRTLERYPEDYAYTQANLGAAYVERVEGSKADNLERAIACFQATRVVQTAERFPFDYAITQNHLGNAYSARVAGDRRDNLERAIACFRAALTIQTADRYPKDHAGALSNLGLAYRERVAGDRRDNLERAIACFQSAGAVFTMERFPDEHRQVQLKRALVAADAGHWDMAHEALEDALTAEELLLPLGGGVSGRDVVLAEGANAASYNGVMLARLGRYEEAALSVERGRARSLAESQRLRAEDPARIRDLARRAQYEAARAALDAAQRDLDLPISDDDLAARIDVSSFASLSREARRATLERAKRTTELDRYDAFARARTSFDNTVAEIRAAHDPADFLLAPLNVMDLYRAAARGGPGHALVYLIASHWGGLALSVFTDFPAQGSSAHVAALDLPYLTYDKISDLLQRRLGPAHENAIIGGYGWAQEGGGFNLLSGYWPGATLREKAQALRAGCLEAGIDGTLEAATWRTISALVATGREDIVDKPVRAIAGRDARMVAGTLNSLLLRAELRRGLATLAEVAMRPLADWLYKNGATGVTLVPCGYLAAFPLAAAEITSDPTVTFGDAFPTSVAPSARALLRDDSDYKRASERRFGVAALGDPLPTHQRLEWGEAEALTFVALARGLGLNADVRIGEEARRGWLLDRLANVLVLDASCHGVFNADEPLDSALLLAGVPGASKGERLTLRDLLHQSHADHGMLFGLRLLILSACQTGVLELRGAHDEMRSLTAGVLEAEADAAMGALWSVSDKATYLLITRFAQLWLPKLETMPPARALADAQRWLRTVTNAQLRSWRPQDFPEAVIDRQPVEGESVLKYASSPVEEEVMANPPPKHEGMVAVRGLGDCLEVDPEEMVDPNRVDFAADAESEERAQRYNEQEAQYYARERAERGADDDCPYADPYYWAAFQITGW